MASGRLASATSCLLFAVTSIVTVRHFHLDDTSPVVVALILTFRTPLLLPGVETIRISRAEGCGPWGGANVDNDRYHCNMWITWKLGTNKIAYNSRFALVI